MIAQGKRGAAAIGLALGLPLLALSAALGARAEGGQVSCPRLAPEAFAARLTASRTLPARHFGFGGAHFSRASGHANCETASAKGAGFPVCRFSNPVALQVTTGRGRYDYFPGSGPATVTVRDGEASCLRGR